MKYYILDKDELANGVVVARMNPVKNIDKIEIPKDCCVVESENLPSGVYYNKELEKIMPIDKYYLYKNKKYNLEPGEYIENGTILKVPKPDKDYYIFNSETRSWEKDEKMYNWYLRENYFPKIDKIKKEVQERGFEYVDKEGRVHIQKCRVTDMAYMSSTRSIVEDLISSGVPEEHARVPWSFNDRDVLLLDINEIKNIQKTGGLFNNIVFGAERMLKSITPFEIDTPDFLRAMEEVKKEITKNMGLS